MTDLLVLHGTHTSLVLEPRADGAPLWRYWGPRLGDGFAAAPSALSEPWHLGYQLERPARFDLFAGFGLGWFQRPALEAHREGRDFTFAATRTGFVQECGRITVELEDEVSRIAARIVLALDPASDTLTIETALTNTGDAPLTVQWLQSGSLPLPAGAATVRHYAGRHANEFEVQDDPLGKAIWLRENRHGITSHAVFPGAVVLTRGAGEHHGLAYAAQLAWSGNHVQAIDPLDDGRRQWQLGMALAPGELILAPGETVNAPALFATCSEQGSQGAARNFHAALRQKITWPGGAMSPRKVHINTWEGRYFDHDEAGLKAFADRSAALGVERFVLDDGWFHRRNDDTTSLGDWWPDAAKYPNGLKPLADHVTALGMEFGLWIEPEMVNPDSELYRAHPDWALQLAGRPVQTSRNQLVLDLTNPAVGDYLFDTIGRVMADLPLSYLKWDHNRDLVAAGDAGGRAAYRRQVLAFYALLGRFRQAFPAVEIESCAGGGGRIDAGVLPHVHRFWASDCLDALTRLTVQRGFLQFLPPEVMGSHVGTAPAHTTGRSQPLDFRAAVALQGHFGVELDPERMSEAESAALRGWIAFYKTWRGHLHGAVWNGTTADGLVWHAAGTPQDWLLLVYRIEPAAQPFPALLPLPFADPAARYGVARIGPDRHDPEALFDGSWLARAGLALPPLHAERAAIYHGQAQ